MNLVSSNDYMRISNTQSNEDFAVMHLALKVLLYILCCAKHFYVPQVCGLCLMLIEVESAQFLLLTAGGTYAYVCGVEQN